MEINDRVRIISNDPTRYLRRGTSATPTTDVLGTVVHVEESIWKKQIVSVRWDDGTYGEYMEHALVRCDSFRPNDDGSVTYISHTGQEHTYDPDQAFPRDQ